MQMKKPGTHDCSRAKINARGLGAPGQMTLEKMYASDHRIPWRRAAGTAGRPSH